MCKSKTRVTNWPSKNLDRRMNIHAQTHPHSLSPDQLLADRLSGFVLEPETPTLSSLLLPLPLLLSLIGASDNFFGSLASSVTLETRDLLVPQTPALVTDMCPSCLLVLLRLEAIEYACVCVDVRTWFLCSYFQ